MSLYLATTGFLAQAANRMVLAAVETTGGEQPWFDELIHNVYSPEWNAEHRVFIWGLIIFVLVTGCVGIPSPEDIWLMLAGFTTFLSTGLAEPGSEFGIVHFFWFTVAFFACAAANMVGDIAIWWGGKTFGLGIRRRFKFMQKVITDKHLATTDRWFKKYGAWTVFLGRQLAGVRFCTFFVAGTIRMHPIKFLAFDLLGHVVSVPVWLFLGAMIAHPSYGEKWVKEVSGKVSNGILIGAIAAIIIFIAVIKIRGALRSKKEDQLADEVLGGEVVLNAPKAESPVEEKNGEAVVDLSKPAEPISAASDAAK